jgi:mRNA interferase HigB
MKVLGKNHLATFAARHADVRSALAVWEREVEDATWKSPSDLKERYPRASFVGGDHVVFDIRGGNYRLHARVSYSMGVLLIVRIGTHSEYDRWTF